MLTVFALIALLLAAAALGFFAYGRERTWERLAGSADFGRYDFARAERTGTGNDVLAATPGLTGGKPDIVLRAASAPPAGLVEALARAIAYDDPAARRVDDRSDPLHLRYVTHSPFMRFPDFTVIEAVALPDGQTGLRAYARAQLGSNDIGANRKRLEAWLADFMTPQASKKPAALEQPPSQ